MKFSIGDVVRYKLPQAKRLRKGIGVISDLGKYGPGPDEWWYYIAGEPFREYELTLLSKIKK